MGCLASKEAISEQDVKLSKPSELEVSARANPTEQNPCSACAVTGSDVGEHDENITVAQPQDDTLNVYRTASKLAYEKGILIADAKMDFGGAMVLADAAAVEIAGHLDAFLPHKDCEQSEEGRRVTGKAGSWGWYAITTTVLGEGDAEFSVELLQAVAPHTWSVGVRKPEERRSALLDNKGGFSVDRKFSGRVGRYHSSPQLHAGGQITVSWHAEAQKLEFVLTGACTIYVPTGETEWDAGREVDNEVYGPQTIACHQERVLEWAGDFRGYHFAVGGFEENVVWRMVARAT